MYKILSKEQLRKNLDEVIERIEKKRLEVDKHLIVQLVVVTKYSPIENIKSLYELGQRSFGENYVQSLEEKSNALKEYPISWHMIGRIQKNKINKLLELNPFLIQSIDSIETAKAIDKRVKKDKKVPILLQINSAQEESKAGVMPKEAIDSYLQIKSECKNLELKGVMSIGAHTQDKEVIKKSFEVTYKIFEKLKNEGAKICSMGMSQDFELAIECGSNMVRIGSLLFKED